MNWQIIIHKNKYYNLIRLLDIIKGAKLDNEDTCYRVKKVLWGRIWIAELRNRGYDQIFEFDIDTDKSLLNKYTKECDFVFHLAGVNRPKDEKEFMKGNFGFTAETIRFTKKTRK